jgi:hypothetical protein
MENTNQVVKNAVAVQYANTTNINQVVKNAVEVNYVKTNGVKRGNNQNMKGIVCRVL